MIRLTKGPIPTLLAQHAEDWTRRLLEIIAAGEKPTDYLLGRYRQPEIKNALLAETHKKCAYCESPVRHVTYGDIEHIVPKAVEPHRRFDWANLTIACDVCNTNKAENCGLLDPYQCTPGEHFEFHGPLMWARPASAEALLTEEILDLNRDGLIERRKERLDYLRSLVDSACSKPNDIRDAMLQRAEREVMVDKPYSECAGRLLRILRHRYGVAGAETG